jgi:hypothetical protein
MKLWTLPFLFVLFYYFLSPQESMFSTANMPLMELSPALIKTSDCNPYFKRGTRCKTLKLSGYLWNNVWVAFENCSATKNYFDTSQNLTFLKDKTIVFMGDSTETNTVETACRLLKWDLILDDHYLNLEKTASNHTWPRRCVSKNNAMLISLFHHGIIMGQLYLFNNGKQSFEERVKNLFIPYLKKLTRYPDIIIMNSAAEDVRLMIQKCVDSGNLVKDEMLSPKDIQRFHRRVINAMKYLVDHFPKSTISWRTQPDTRQSFFDKPYHIFNRFIHTVRNAAVNAITIFNQNSEARKVIIFDWNYWMTSNMLDYKDLFLLGDSGNIVFMNALFHYLNTDSN